MGGDGILPIVLKHVATALLEPIHHLLSFVYLSLTYQLSGAVIVLLLSLNVTISLVSPTITYLFAVQFI